MLDNGVEMCAACGKIMSISRALFQVEEILLPDNFGPVI